MPIDFDLTPSLLQDQLTQLRLFQTAIEGSTSGITIADASLPDMPLIYANLRFYEMTGYAPAEIIGRNCRFLQGRERKQPSLEILRDAISTGEQCQVELINFRKDGSRFWNELHIYPLRGESGVVTHFVGVQNDITVRKQSELALREHKNQLEDAQRLANLGSWRWDLRTSDVYWSDTLHKICGTSPETFRPTMGNSLALLPDEEREMLQRHVLNSLHTKESFDVFHTIVRHDSEERLLHSRGHVIRNGNGAPIGVMATVQDMTDQQRAEAALIEAEGLRIEIEKERELVELRQRFITTVTHDFRTPFAVISMNVDLLTLRAADLTSEKAQKHLRRIKEQVYRMSDNLDDVLAFSKGQAGKHQIKPSNVNLLQWCNELIEQAQSYDRFDHLIVFDYCCPGTIYSIDTNVMEKVVLNLLTNAIKYSPSQSHIFFNVDVFANSLRFRVRDEGIGIPLVDQKRLFAPFFRASNTGKTQGTGLGLSIVKQSVEAHGGKISFESIPQTGTTFTVILPIV